MKKLILWIILLFVMLPPMTSCQSFELNEHMIEASFVYDESQTGNPGDMERRVQLTLMVKGINKERYTIDYTIDGEAGIDKKALTIIGEAAESETGQYSFGEIHMEKQLFTNDYNGNFPTGSSVKLRYQNNGSYTHPSVGTAVFLSPKLGAGRHIIAFTVTNSYGDKISGSKEFTI